MAYLMGIDLGTSSVKTVLFDELGQTISSAQEKYDIHIPSPGFAEQKPDEWWDATVRSIRRALSNANMQPRDIKGIGLSGQMHGLVALNGALEPAAPAMIWCDQRSTEQVNRIYKQLGRKKYGSVTMNPSITGFQLPSLLWLQEHVPERFETIRTVLSPKDYIRYKLCGEIGTEHTDASATGLYDQAMQGWSKDILHRLKLDEAWFPAICSPEQKAGEIGRMAAKETGFMQGTPVVYGGADQPMQALGNGIIAKDTISVTIGTGGQLFAVIDEPGYDQKHRIHTFRHALPNTWYMLGATLSAGLSLSWLASQIVREPDFDRLSAMAATIPPGSEGLIYLPYLIGERTPHMDPSAKGMFFGLTLKHHYAHLARAVMEGVVYSLKDGIDIMRSLPISMQRVVSSGGGARSKLWKQIQADILQVPIYTTLSDEQACLGAAITASVGARLYSSIAEACGQMVRYHSEVVYPNGSNQKVYTEGHHLYKRLYKCHQQLYEA